MANCSDGNKIMTSFNVFHSELRKIEQRATGMRNLRSLCEKLDPKASARSRITVKPSWKVEGSEADGWIVELKF